MKKFISIILSIMIFICLFLLTIILNINALFKKSNIRKINNSMDYTELVDIMGEKINVEKNFDNIYGKLLENKFTSMEITNLYNSKYIKEMVIKIETDNINYLLYKKEYKPVTTDDIGLDIKLNGIKDIKGNDISSKITDSVKEIINASFKESEENIKEEIDSIPSVYLKIIRYMFKNTFKVILVALILINCIILIMINKNKFIPYIFVPCMIVGIIEILIVFFLDNIIYKTLDNFMYILMHPYVEYFTNKLLITSLIIMCISLFYLAIGDKIDEKSKVFLRKKLKVKKEY